MNTREMAKAYRLSKWSQAFQERTTSGESINDFCGSRGISRNTYFYWQRKLREAAMNGLVPVANEKTTQAMVPSGWAVCEPAKAPACAIGTINIEIGKSKISATADTDSELLAKVCRVLMSLC